jgi:hypothetical protein
MTPQSLFNLKSTAKNGDVMLYVHGCAVFSQPADAMQPSVLMLPESLPLFKQLTLQFSGNGKMKSFHTSQPVV